MNLLNFDQYMDDIILERGLKYFQKGQVINIEEMKSNHFHILIEGSEVYQVDVFLNAAKEIITTSCDCPYDIGEFCKHQVAAFFALRNPEKIEKENSKLSVEEIISKLSKEELGDIILHFSDEYPEMEKKLLLQHSPKQEEVAVSKKLIREYINKAKDRGFIKWGNVRYALTGANITLEKAQEKLGSGELESAVSLSIATLSIVVDNLDRIDDSSGYAWDVIRESLAIIEEAANSIYLLNEQEQNTLFASILKEAMHKRYDDWDDWRMSLLSSCAYFCSNKKLREKLDKQLGKLLDNLTGDSWRGKYKEDEIKLVQLKLMELYDEEEKATQFIKANIHRDPFRKKAIEYLMEDGEFLEVIRLCQEGEMIDQEHRGLVHQWKVFSLVAYEALGDIQKQKELLFEFLLKNDYEYYSKLKKLYSSSEWEEVLQQILQTFEREKRPPQAYLEILKEEKLYDKLLDYCAHHLSSIEHLYPFLIDQYFEKVNELYKKYIEVEAKEATDRKKYKGVCKLIKAYKKVCGDIHGKQLIDKLKIIYPNRPAFLDELGKIPI